MTTNLYSGLGKTFSRSATCFFFSAILFFASQALNADTVSDAASFFAKPDFAHPQFSPDGKYIAFLRPSGRQGNLSLFTLELETNVLRGFAAEKNQEIYYFRWLNDEWLVFNVSVNNLYSLGVYAVKRDDGKSLATCELASNSRILSNDFSDPNQFWVHLINSNAHTDSELVKYDISLVSSRKGEWKTSFASKGRAIARLKDPEGGIVSDWIFDAKGNPRIASSFRDGEKQEHYYLIEDDEKWKELPIDPEIFTILGYVEENSIYVVGYQEEATSNLFRYDIEKDAVIEHIHRDADYDMNDIDLYYHPQTRKLLGFYYEGKTLQHQWFDGEANNHQLVYDKQFPNHRNRIISFSNDLNQSICASSTPSLPSTYYMLDLEAMKLKQLGQTNPALQPEMVSPVFRFNFKSNDSLELEALLTKSSFTNGKQPPPMVVLIHGGPWVRDNWSYDSEAQFLAKLGYNVLQVNYRGSSGYGREISEQNAFEFEAMVEDVKTATDLAVKQGWANPDRIAVMGASFGGYASIFLASKYPDFFQCAVGTVGVYDLVEQLKSLEHKSLRGTEIATSAYHYWKNNVGDPKLDEAYLDSISPIHFADKIKCPVFLAHGIDDNIASFKQSKRLLKVLKKNSIPIETYFKYNEGHGFSDENKRVEYYERLQAFLAKYL